MKRHSSQLEIWLLAALALITGCHQKKAATVPPQATAPTVSTAPPQPATQPAPTNQPVVIIAPSNSPNTNVGVTKPKTKPKPRPVHAHKNVPGGAPATSGTLAGKETNTTATAVASLPAPTASPSPSPNTTANNTASKTIVREGSAADPAAGVILPGTDHNEAAQQRHATEQLLQSTDDALKSITRPLNDDERAMVEQIRNYMTQARAATIDGDLVRANNLAVKAHLLSDALIKH